MEEWKSIDGYELYSVSNYGNIKNNKTQKIKIPQIDYKGYKRVQLRNGDKVKNFRIHRLVAIYFLENINNYCDVDHIDRDKLNNNASNLRWVSSSLNCRNRKKRTNSTSKYVGVSFIKSKQKWQSQICVDYKITYIGLFVNEIDAAIAYNNYIIGNNLTHFILNKIE